MTLHWSNVHITLYLRIIYACLTAWPGVCSLWPGVSVSLGRPEPESDQRSRSRDLGLGLPRGQSRYDDLLWLSLQCTFTTECPPKKKLFSATALYIRDLYLYTLLKAEAGSGKKQEKIKSSKIQAFLNKQEDFNSLLFYSLNVNRIWALMKT